eukprot:Sdes_comp24184_c0_seq1m22205
MALNSVHYQKALQSFQEKYKNTKLPLEITPSQMNQHNSETDCWVIIHKKVFDATFYLNIHPGGITFIMNHAGDDATEDFEAGFHGLNARKILESFYIGDLILPQKMNTLT